MFNRDPHQPTINPEVAARLRLIMASQGDVGARSNLGYGYEKGGFGRQDYKEAARIYRFFADQGNAAIQNNLGNLYKEGLGVTQDIQEAARLYRLSAAQGSSAAQFNLAGLYIKGFGIAQDYKEAARLYRLSADQGNADAQFNLACLYEYGLGVTQNSKEAARLYMMCEDQAMKGLIGEAHDDKQTISSQQLEHKESGLASESVLSVMQLVNTLDQSCQKNKYKLIEKLKLLESHYKIKNKAEHVEFCYSMQAILNGEVELPHIWNPALYYTPTLIKKAQENNHILRNLLISKLKKDEYEFVVEFLLKNYDANNLFHDEILLIKYENKLGKFFHGEFKLFINQVDNNKKELKEKIKNEIEKITDKDKRLSLIEKMIAELPEKYKLLAGIVREEIIIAEQARKIMGR